MVYNDTRDAIFGELYKIALNDKNVVVMTADTGALKFEEFQRDMPNRFYNVGVAEANMMSVAAGLALEGKHVFVFGISNFVTMRCLEQVKIDICAMNLPVTILGMGTGYSYGTDGPTHHITEDVAIMRALPNMTIWSPSDYTMTAQLVNTAYKLNAPSYIRFDKGPFENIYTVEDEFDDGIKKMFNTFHDATIVATGITVTQALEVQKTLADDDYYVSVIDFYRLKPVNRYMFYELMLDVKRILTLEEHCRDGGLGSIVLESLNDCGLNIPMKRIGLADCFRPKPGSREYLRGLSGSNTESVVNALKGWVRNGV